MRRARLAWLTEGARFFARVPWAAAQLPPFPLWLLLAYYAIVVGGWLWAILPANAAQAGLDNAPAHSSRGSW